MAENKDIQDPINPLEIAFESAAKWLLAPADDPHAMPMSCKLVFAKRAGFMPYTVNGSPLIIGTAPGVYLKQGDPIVQINMPAIGPIVTDVNDSLILIPVN